MPASAVSTKDDLPTVIALSALACILQDVLHEGLGHGVTAWLSGARQLTMSTVALQSDIDSRWISANGTLVNLLFAGIFWLLLLKPQRYKPVTFYFSPGARHGGKSFYRHRLFPVFWRRQLRGLGGRDSRPATAPDVAGGIDSAGRGVLLRVHAACGVQAKTISWQR